MPGGPFRFLALATFLVVVAVGLSLAEVGRSTLVAGMAVATVVACFLEWLGWREAGASRPSPVRRMTGPAMGGGREDGARERDIAAPQEAEPVPARLPEREVGESAPPAPTGGRARRDADGKAGEARAPETAEAPRRRSWLRRLGRRHAAPAGEPSPAGAGGRASAPPPEEPAPDEATAVAPEAEAASARPAGPEAVMPEAEAAAAAGAPEPPAPEEPLPADREPPAPVDAEAGGEDGRPEPGEADPEARGAPEEAADEAHEAPPPVEPAVRAPERRERARSFVRLRAIPPAQPLETHPAVAARPAGAAARPAPQVVRLPQRTPEPREWNIWELERLAREEARRTPARAEEWSYLFLHLREFADVRGTLPVEFDDLVRESFGSLVEQLERG